MAVGPLAGVKVLDLTSVVVGPLCTQVLADHGADVIKVESTSGDLARTMSGPSVTSKMGPKFLHLNRNKRSIALDLKSSAGKAALRRLIAESDVLAWNMRPVAMRRLGLTYEEVRRLNPTIIYCGMYGVGQGGRYRARPAYDTTIQGVAGVAALNHRALGDPKYVPMVVADKIVGLIAVQMIAMALYQRCQTGEGCSVEIPMFENMAKFVLEDHMYLETFVPPLGAMGDPRVLNALSSPTRTSDGWICVSANTDAQAFALFDAIGRPELKADPRFQTVVQRYRNVDAYFQIRADELAKHDSAHWLALFDERDIPAMPYNTLEDLLDDPHLQDVGFFELKEHPTEGTIRSIAPPNLWSTPIRQDWSPPPKLGQDSVSILKEAGFAAGEIEAMIAEGNVIDGRVTETVDGDA